MRGSPLLRALAAFFFIALAGIPLARLTRRAEAVTTPPAAVAQVASEEAAVAVAMELAFTQRPSRVAVMHLGKEIWAAADPEAKLEQELRIPWPKDGVDLRFMVTWPDDAPLAAARVKITTPDGRELERSIWSQGPADEVLTFQ